MDSDRAGPSVRLLEARAVAAGRSHEPGLPLRLQLLHGLSGICAPVQPGVSRRPGPSFDHRARERRATPRSWCADPHPAAMAPTIWSSIPRCGPRRVCRSSFPPGEPSVTWCEHRRSEGHCPGTGHGSGRVEELPRDSRGLESAGLNRRIQRARLGRAGSRTELRPVRHFKLRLTPGTCRPGAGAWRNQGGCGRLHGRLRGRHRASRVLPRSIRRTPRGP